MSKYPQVPDILITPEHNFMKDFYMPCIQWADYYDRVIGYFTSELIKNNVKGLSCFAAEGGEARWITSLNMRKKDHETIIKRLVEPDNLDIIEILKENIDEIKSLLENNTLNALGWLIYDGVIEFKFALPTNKSESGDIYDKFGIFYKSDGRELSYKEPEINDKKGRIRHENIKVFKSWQGLGSSVDMNKKRFQKLWDDEDPNVDVYKLPQVIKNNLINLRIASRPYSKNKSRAEKKYKWRHQDEAVKKFLQQENGILEMATGTGKTRTSFKIMNNLLENNHINNVVITAKGTDLLDQWEKEIYKWTELSLYKHYGSYKDMADFKYNFEGSILLISNYFLSELISYFKPNITDYALLICDEVHNFGSNKMVERLSGEIKKFKYRLGLSATPERPYDEEGNKFLEEEIGGNVIEFGLKDAIKRGILCEFNYFPLGYELAEEDKKKKRDIIARYNALKKEGKGYNKEDMFIELSNVVKSSPAKLPVFKDFLSKSSNILQNTLIFVHSKDYGEMVQEIIIRHVPEYHTYYSGDSKDNLYKFSQGGINCLITCKKLSEGIDIKSVNNIVLFASDKSRLQTIQRIGRSLRTNPDHPNKVAGIVDFIEINTEADQMRREWLEELSSIQKEEN